MRCTFGGTPAFVVCLPSKRFSLGEIRGIVALRDEGGAPCGDLLELLRRHSTEIERTIRELRRLQAELGLFAVVIPPALPTLV